LEEVVIDLLCSLGIRGHRVGRYSGVWVDEKKICSIGIHVSRHITTHGFALNVNNDLRFFEYIKPCGMQSDIMTSIAELLGYGLPIENVITHLLHSFSEAFELKHEPCLFNVLKNILLDKDFGGQ
jgi:lipoyl(octanoyl) transferase